MLDTLYQDIYKTPQIKKANLEDLAARLSEIAHKEPPWTWRYLNGILKGHKGITIGKELDRAIVALGAVVDGQHILLARAHPIRAYSINGNVKKDAIILLKSKRCVYSRCQIEFVGYPWQKGCCPEHTRKARRERGK